MSIVSGSLSSAVASVVYTNTASYPLGFNLSITGTFVAMFILERSFDGVNWEVCTAGGTYISFSAPLSEVISDPEFNVRYRIRVTSYTSGTINYRFGP